jgi:hypothetical protein
MVYYEEQPPDRERPPGCLDVLVITRAVFAILFWPIVALFAVLADVSVTFYLFATRPVLALVPVTITAIVLWLFARWDRRHFRPPDA